ncbi:unnamed protein product [Eruca vesicaria subsp. sativa]|uniref:tRNA-uridine aminocarboxypropyltransferase n=1 Tax=Eruca vesicaria subsp. sativa TaxID=29727 RepID=A0ABC8KJ40_ERUVS|nr:unnamed protein product [Eruca vesicaria subsp. sativa]
MEEEKTADAKRRQICNNCDRPKPICICHVIPSEPIPTKTEILILHHPHESRHKLNTTHLLVKSLLNVTRIPGRRLRNRHISTSLPKPSHTIYLFPPSPSSPAVTVSEFKISLNLLTDPPPSLRLIVFDATWKHAKEMVKASEEVLREAGAVRVCLDAGIDESVSGGSIYDSELLLRKEPVGGCVSTAEAVARCLGGLEVEGEEIERKLISVLKEMVRLQSEFLKPMRPRPKLLKKRLLQNHQRTFEQEEEEE